jgi:hypothetical protein
MKHTTPLTQDTDTVLNQLFSDMRKDAKKICDLEQALAIKDSALLQGSIQLIDLQRENQRLNAIASTFKLHTRASLSSFEARFDNDPDQFVPEEMYEYIDSAKFMEKNFGRVVNYIVAVTLYLKTLKA